METSTRRNVGSEPGMVEAGSTLRQRKIPPEQRLKRI